MVKTLVAIAVIATVLAPSGVQASHEPELQEPFADRAGALSCPSRFTSAHEPVLLVHGTAITAEESWSWNHEGTLRDEGYDVCTVQLPERAMVDIQRSAEYVVHAVRHMSLVSGKPVDVIGHSQGALEPRWAAKYWPDTVGAQLDDMLLLAGPHHGASGADLGCTDECQPSVWQMKTGSAFLEALNAGDETAGAGDYTSVYSDFDELVQPPSTSELDGAVNVHVQALCPGRPVHHVGQLHDAVVHAVIMDALTHEGPADLSRFDPATCLEDTMPGVTAIDAIAGNAWLYAAGADTFATSERTTAEPALRDYAR